MTSIKRFLRQKTSLSHDTGGRKNDAGGLLQFIIRGLGTNAEGDIRIGSFGQRQFGNIYLKESLDIGYSK